MLIPRLASFINRRFVALYIHCKTLLGTESEGILNHNLDPGITVSSLTWSDCFTPLKLWMLALSECFFLDDINEGFSFDFGANPLCFLQWGIY